MTNKPILPFVETMVTQVCNLSCYGCTNYSDLPHRGYVSWQEGRRQIESWLDRVDILDFGILGGEPLVNPEIEDWILGLRKLMPDTQIRFTTNGLLLKKKPHIVKLLHDVGNVVFKISDHQIDTELESTIDKILNEHAWEEVTEFGIVRWKTSNNFRFYTKKQEIFWKTHRGNFSDMLPHHSNPNDAFEVCCQKTCPLLYQGKIYKCSSNGLLVDTLQRFNNPNYSEWEQYIDRGIAPDCSETDLQCFLNNFGKPAKICGMCPTKDHIDSKILHLQNVKLKKEISILPKT